MLHLLVTATTHASLGADVTCPGNASACPANATCCTHEYYDADGCVFAPGGPCCAPGAAHEPSATQPNCLIIGDSVSLGFTPHVASILGRNRTCAVQHAPWVGGGSANNAANGLNNLQRCRWLSSAMRPEVDVRWDVIQYNFGLHDLEKNTSALLDVYEQQLEGITAILLASGARHVQYASTTPFMPDTLAGDDVVPALNKRAAAVAARHGVPVLDLNGVVHQHCGATYSSCSLCDNETKYHPGVYCGYHYTQQGYEVLGEAVATSFERLLAPNPAR